MNTTPAVRLDPAPDAPRVSILGAGAIGSSFAHRFARAGRDVTLIARGARLEALRDAGGRLTARHPATRARTQVVVRVSDALDDEPAPDVLFVTVRRQHVDALLPRIAATRAGLVVFVFNVATDLTRFRDAVGAARFSWAFPAAVARFEGDVLVHAVVPAALGALQITTIGGIDGVSPPGLARVQRLFREAGIPVAICNDMGSWLKTHAAFMAPLIAAGALAKRRGGLDTSDAALAARAMAEGMRAVTRSGASIVPQSMRVLERMPVRSRSIAMWLAFRVARLDRALAGAHATDEAIAMLLDLERLDPIGTPALRALRDAISG